MKIGIITYHRSYNYGAYLQACALCNRLNMEKNIEAEIIDYRMKKERNEYDPLYTKLRTKLSYIKHNKYFFQMQLKKCFEKAVHDPIMKKSQDYILSDSIEDFRNRVRNIYDIIIAGSDEIWKADNFRGFPNAYFLIGDLNCRKLAYAVSARVHYQDILNKSDYNLLVNAVKDFEYIGVRDSITLSEIKTIVGEQTTVNMCCDPTFLYDFKPVKYSVLDKIAEKHRLQNEKKNALVFIENGKRNDEIVERMVLELKDQYNLIAIHSPHRGCINCPEISPIEFVSLIREVDIIITSSFHGACFSIIHNKKFIAFSENAERKTKIEELLTDDAFKDMYLVNIGEVKSFIHLIDTLPDHVDYSAYVAKQREGFRKFIKALNS